MKRAILLLVLSLIGSFVIAGMIWRNPVYISTAVLGEAPNPPFDYGETRFTDRIAGLQQAVLSRAILTDMIEKLNLYPEESRRVPMEDLIENCRMKEVRIRPIWNARQHSAEKQPVDSRAFALSFRHKDPRLAQRTAEYLTSRFMEADIKQREADANTVADFLKEQANTAVKEWIAKQEALPRNLSEDERRIAALDAELAHAHYLQLRAKAANAAMTRNGELRSLGPRLELIDSASLPSSPEARWVPALGFGAVVGSLIGLLILSIPFLRRVTLRQGTIAFVCGAACLTLAWIVVDMTDCHTYTSTANLAMRYGIISQSLVPTVARAVPELLASTHGSVLGRANLTNIISTYGLYPQLIRSEPLESIIDRMREHIEINEFGEVFAIRFKYNNRFIAQKVAADLVERMMDGFHRLQATQSKSIVQFLERECDLTAKDWTRAAHATGPNPDRLALDIELARKRYIALKEKAANASFADGLVSHRTEAKRPPTGLTPLTTYAGLKTPPQKEWKFGPGPHLEVLDPASLRPETEILDNTILAASALFGVIAGLIWQRPRRVAV